MSNNSMVCRDPAGGTGEIGRAQWVQALAAGVTPEPAMNPVLLKPGSDLASQVVLLGQAVDTITAGTFRTLRPRLAETAYAALAELLLVNTMTSLFSGVMPVPGGIGVLLSTIPCRCAYLPTLKAFA